MSTTREAIAAVRRDLVVDRRVRMRLHNGGRLNIDRQLPFVCLYRAPADRPDAGTSDLLLGQSSFISVSADDPDRDRTGELVAAIADVCAPLMGAFLVIEVWSSPPERVEEAAEGAARPGFEIVALESQEDDVEPVASALQSALQRISLRKRQATATVRFARKVIPPGLRRLMRSRKDSPHGVYHLGVVVQPTYRDATTGELFPLDLRSYRRSFTRALRRGLFEFSKRLTSHAPRHYHVLGRRAFTRAAAVVDGKLSAIASSFDFLLLVTPINTEAAWRRFRKSSFARTPLLRLRPLTIDPAHLKRQLYGIDIDRVEDPTLESLFHEKRLEMDRQLTMLLERGTRNFRLGSVQLYGAVDDETAGAAEHLLSQLSETTPRETLTGTVKPAAFARRAEAEIDKFAHLFGGARSRVSVVDDVTGVIVSSGELLIGSSFRTYRDRVEALIQHEVGTHVATYWNGRSQPLGLLSVGLPGYDEMQEGLAMLRELAAGGIDERRLAMLAARVVAARSVEQGAGFIDTFRMLHRGYGLVEKTAFNAAVRVHRSGGLTKDAVYLRGLLDLARRVRSGTKIGTLFAGKFAARHIPIVRELLMRGVLSKPPVDPTEEMASTLGWRLAELVRRYELQQWIP